MKTWNIHQADMDAYLKVCKEAAEDDNVFASFKRNPAYTKILEHASYSQGYYYFNRIPFIDSDFFTSNDKYGSPERFDYGGILISPTTLQYTYVLHRIIHLIGSLKEFNIIEIGGGYGGQCKIINDYCQPKEYTIIDLEEPGLLQEKYLSKFGIKANIVSPLYAERARPCDLVISNYALSEIIEPYQTHYVRSILLHAKHGYITCNGPINAIDELKENFPGLKITPDIEGERKENFIITW